MSPPLFAVPALPDLGPTRLAGAAGHHAAAVLRLTAGELVGLTDTRGGLARARVQAREPGALTVVVEAVLHQPPPVPRLVLVQALAKGDRAERAVATAVELGVDDVVPWAAEHCVARWSGPRGDRSWQGWVDAAAAAAQQARRLHWPVVAPLHTTAAVARRVATATGALVLHEAAGTAVSARLPELLAGVAVAGADGTSAPAGAAAPGGRGEAPAGRAEIVVVVGPEGGLSAAELAQLTSADRPAVRLGAAVLRTETAGAAALAVLAAALGRWEDRLPTADWVRTRPSG